MVLHYIYLTTNKINGMMYIGQRKLPKHLTIENDPYLGSGTYLNYSIKKHGRENFEKVILEFCNNRKEADLLEIKYFDKYNVLENRDNFYNRGLPGQYWRHEGHSKDISARMKEFYSNPENKKRFLAPIAESKKLTLDEYLELKKREENQKKFNKYPLRYRKAIERFFLGEYTFQDVKEYLINPRKYINKKRLKMPGLNASERTKKMWENKEWANRVKNTMKTTKRKAKRKPKKPENNNYLKQCIYKKGISVQSLGNSATHFVYGYSRKKWKTLENAIEGIKYGHEVLKNLGIDISLQRLINDYQSD